jgi:hypothetical protein
MQFIFYLRLGKSTRTRRLFTMVGLRDVLPWPKYKTVYHAQYDDVLSWPEYRAVYLGQNKICFTFGGERGGLPWPEYNMLYLCWSTRQFTLARIQDCTLVRTHYALPLLEYKAVYLRQNIRWFTVAMQQSSIVQDGLPFPDYKMYSITMASIQDELPWLVYKMDYLG